MIDEHRGPAVQPRRSLPIYLYARTCGHAYEGGPTMEDDPRLTCGLLRQCGERIRNYRTSGARQRR
jgi:predicted nucleic acid-binding Zn ribbon protein